MCVCYSCCYTVIILTVTTHSLTCCSSHCPFCSVIIISFLNHLTCKPSLNTMPKRKKVEILRMELFNTCILTSPKRQVDLCMLAADWDIYIYIYTIQKMAPSIQTFSPCLVIISIKHQRMTLYLFSIYCPTAANTAKQQKQPPWSMFCKGPSRISLYMTSFWLQGISIPPLPRNPAKCTTH